MGGRQEVPVYSKYTAVYFQVYGRILRSIRQEYFSNTSSILINTSKKCRLPHTGVGVWNRLCGFLTLRPPNFRVLNSFFHIPWAHRTTRYM